MHEISITSIPGIRIGQAENVQAATGLTVILSDKGMAAGLDVRGGGPASRESELLKPTANAGFIHAVVLSGGSAFGLDAAGGVMAYLEEHGIGYETGFAKVPLVCQSDLYDLGVGSASVRPDQAMGYAACEAAETGNYEDGNHGAGTGATVGKLAGAARCMKSGIGSYAVQIGQVQVGAIVAVNALGDVYDWRTGQQIAGLLTEDRTGLQDSAELLYKSMAPADNKFVTNTTIGAIITNAAFNKTQLCKIASMAHNGMARAIRPVHTSADGDSLYALSCGEIAADVDVVGTLAADVLAEAIRRAVLSSESAYGLPSAKDLKK